MQDTCLFDLIEHHLENIGERVNINDVIPKLPDDFNGMSDAEQQDVVRSICKTI